MKTRIQLASAILLAVLLLPLTTLNTGCKTWNQDKAETISYKTLGSVAESVDAALKVYAEVWSAGNVSAENDARIEAVHQKYRASMAVAIAAARTNWNTPASADVVAIATELINLIKEVL